MALRLTLSEQCRRCVIYRSSRLYSSESSNNGGDDSITNRESTANEISKTLNKIFENKKNLKPILNVHETLEEEDSAKEAISVKDSEQKIENRKESFKKMFSLLKETKSKNSYKVEAPARKKVPKALLNHLDVNEGLRKAVFNATKVLNKDEVTAADELLTNFKKHTPESSSPVKLIDLLQTMKMEHQPTKSSYSSSRQTFKLRSRAYSIKNLWKVDVESAERLNIFNPEENKIEDKNFLETYAKCEQRLLKTLTYRAPKNFFEDQIRMTEAGKLWTFPVDNEIGLEEERKYTFVDHIFLEKHLNAWCPKSGPVRHFMHLVCAGLSCNPYLTVKRKIEHINWYELYFGMNSKRTLMENSGVPEHLLPSMAKEQNVVPKKDIYPVYRYGDGKKSAVEKKLK